MPEIPQFSPREAIPIVTDAARADPNALALPGREEARQGLALENLGSDADKTAQALNVLQKASDVTAANTIGADATVKNHDLLQNAMDQARQTGDYTDFTKNIRTQLDQDLATRSQNLSPGARSLLAEHFAGLTDQITNRASTFEHQMQGQATIAQLGNAFDKFGMAASRDPSLAPDLMRQGTDMITRAADAGWLDPEHATKAAKDLRSSIWPGALIGHAASDPNVLTDFNAGKYDQFLDPEMKLALKPHLEAAATKGILGGLTVAPTMGGASGGPIGPQPNASDAEIDTALAPIIQRESKGRPNIGWGETDLTNVPRDATGFPIWPGKPGPQGNSTAAGLYQITGTNWHRIAPALGITDFSAASQRLVAHQLYREGGLSAWGGGGGASGGLAALNARIDAMQLDPDLALKVKAGARVNYDAQEADQARQVRLKTEADKRTVQLAENTVIADQYSGAPKITAQQIAKDPAFDSDPAARLRAIGLVRAAADAEPPKGASAQTAAEIVRRINLADGDPQKITDRAPLVDALGKTLTKGDFDFADKQLTEAQTPFGKQKAQFLKAIEPQIDRSLLPGIANNPAGKEKFYEFQQMLDAAIDDARKQNKNPADLINPSKPEYLGKPELLKQYQLPLNPYADMPRPALASDVDLKSQDSVVAGYKAGKITRQAAAQALTALGVPAAPPPAPPQPQAPLAR